MRVFIFHLPLVLLFGFYLFLSSSPLFCYFILLYFHESFSCKAFDLLGLGQFVLTIFYAIDFAYPIHFSISPPSIATIHSQDSTFDLFGAWNRYEKGLMVSYF